MFSHDLPKLIVVVSALALLAAATPAEKRWDTTTTTATTTFTVTAPASTQTTVNQCNVENTRCCEQTMSSNSPAGTTLLGTVGAALSGPAVLLGSNCSPISIVGIDNGQCSSHPVCCENNSYGSLVSIGCIMIVV